MNRLIALAVCGLLTDSCGSRPRLKSADEIGLSGIVAGPVAGATVRAWRLQDGKRYYDEGFATTAADGSFRVAIGAAQGPWQALIALRSGKPLAVADEQAWLHLNAHFGGADWRKTLPLDLTKGGAQLDDAAREGLILAGLSMLARIKSENANLTLGASLNLMTLAEAAAQDLAADGLFDGIGSQGAINLPPGGLIAYQLDGQTLRSALAQAMLQFVRRGPNASRLGESDVIALAQALASDQDPFHFRPGGGPVDVRPPHIQLLRPSAGEGVHGLLAVDAVATSDNGIRSFAFKLPALGDAQPAFANGGQTAQLSGLLDTRKLPDLPPGIPVEAVDNAGNVADASLHVAISNRGPDLQITAPGEGATLGGRINIHAGTQPKNGGQITSLFLSQPPAGVSVHPTAPDDGRSRKRSCPDYSREATRLRGLPDRRHCRSEDGHRARHPASKTNRPVGS